MSDFISQLAERALALPPLVRPRLQSIYEPPAASVLQNPLEEHIEVPATPPREIESAQEQMLRCPDEQNAAKRANEGIDRKPAATQERKINPQPPSEQPVFAKQDAPRPTPLPDQIESAGEIEPAEPKTPQQRTAQKEDRRLDRVPPAAAKARSVESDLEIRTLPTQKKSIQPQTFSHESKPRVEKQTVQPVVVTVRPAQRPREEQATPTLPLRPMPREQRPRASAPTVHVTIGRVEVRAVMPPTATPKIESSAAPKISLEEYLKARNRASA